MRYVVGFVLVVAVVTLPLGVSAQEMDPLGVQANEAAPKEVHSDAPMSSEERKVRKAKIGLGVSAPVVVAGGIMVLVAADLPVIEISAGSSSDSGKDALLWAGTAVAAAGGVAMIAAGILLGVRKRKLRESKEATRRKVQWDPAGSRLVF